MKKIISLLLVLALSLTVMSSMAFAAELCDEANAVVKLTAEGSDEVKYMDKLDASVVTWICKNMTTGHRTITLLQDVELDPEGSAQASAFFSIPTEDEAWGGKFMGELTFDLNGHTLSYEGEANMFYHKDKAFRVENGTVIYTGTASRFMLSSGATSGDTATNGIPWEPHIVFENVDIYNKGENGVPHLFRSNIFDVVYELIDCRVNCGYGGLVTFQKTSQANLDVPYIGQCVPTMNLTNCVVYTEGDAIFYFGKSKPDGANINIKDSAFATLGSVVDASCAATLTANAEVREVPNYTVTMTDGTEYTSFGYIYGKDPSGTMAFSDVKESDWFYSFVKELYNKGVVAGTTATTFAPNANLTYGAALKLLVVGLTGKDAGNAASGHWAANYLNTAVTSGWTTVGADKLDAPITREAFCEIAAKAAGLTEQAENKFTDTQNPAVLALVKAGVINGMNETTFAPASILTRAQISKIISLLLKL